MSFFRHKKLYETLMGDAPRGLCIPGKSKLNTPTSHNWTRSLGGDPKCHLCDKPLKRYNKEETGANIIEHYQEHGNSCLRFLQRSIAYVHN